MLNITEPSILWNMVNAYTASPSPEILRTIGSYQLAKEDNQNYSHCQFLTLSLRPRCMPHDTCRRVLILSSAFKRLAMLQTNVVILTGDFGGA